MMDTNPTLDQAARAAISGNKSQAQVILAELLRREPKNEEAWLYLAEIVEKQDYAIDCFERVLKINPSNKQARRRLEELKQGRSPQAQRAFYEAAPQPVQSLSPKANLLSQERTSSLPYTSARGMRDTNTAFEEALLAHQQGDKSRAQAILEDIINREPRNEKAWLLLAEVVETKEYAIECLEKVLKINPSNQPVREWLALLRGAEPPASLSSASPIQNIATQAPSFAPSAETSSAGSNNTPQSPVVRATKKCPYCAEEIPAEAIVCPVCERDLASPSGLPFNAPQPPTIKNPARSRLNPIAAIILMVLIILVASRMGFYTIQPIGALPKGATLIIWRTLGEPFFNSPDGTCIRIQGGVSLLCRMAALSQAPVGRIILHLPYIEWAYLMSTGGQVFER